MSTGTVTIPDRVYDGECQRAAHSINSIYRTLPFDHRPFLDPHEEHLDWKRSEEYRTGYACFKYAVAYLLQPKRIVEIGVGSGIAAISFAMAVPDLVYTGLDVGEWDSRLGHRFLDAVDKKFLALRITHQIVRGDSQQVDVLPQCDLVHIDGNHERDFVRHDFVAAWKSGTPWILCDDARDTAVMGGVFDALQFDLDRGSADWAYFPDTFTGNLLVRTDHRRAS